MKKNHRFESLANLVPASDCAHQRFGQWPQHGLKDHSISGIYVKLHSNLLLKCYCWYGTTIRLHDDVSFCYKCFMRSSLTWSKCYKFPATSHQFGEFVYTGMESEITRPPPEHLNWLPIVEMPEPPIPASYLTQPHGFSSNIDCWLHYALDHAFSNQTPKIRKLTVISENLALLTF